MPNQRTEVLTIVFHFLLTLCFLFGYLFTVWKGVPDETLKNLLMVIGGYWFGALAGGKIKDALTKRGDGQ